VHPRLPLFQLKNKKYVVGEFARKAVDSSI